VLRYRTGTAGSAAGATAAARYFLDETLKPENRVLAQYYSGVSLPEMESGMDHLGRAVAKGDLEFSAALDQLMTAHGRMFGWPEDVESLEERLITYVLRAADRSDAHEALATEGGTVARVREDIDPRLAKRLGIDTSRPLTQSDLAHLLAGVRADGLAIEGKQIQKPMKSVAEVFGLSDRQLPSAQDIDCVLAGRRVDGEAPRFGDHAVHAARQRFLTAYGLPADAELTADHVAAMKAGKTATDRFLDAGDVLRKIGATKAPIAYTDMIWSADKSVTVAWALAPTEAERAIISQAHREAVHAAMTYADSQMGMTTRGKGGKDGVERGVTAWIVADHYTSRPTAEVAMVDKDGQAYTEFQTVPMRTADPQLHSHALWLNSVLTESGRIGAMDRDNLDGLVKELGGVYQADLAKHLRAAGIDTRLDPETGAARIMDVPSQVTRHFSKRSQDIERAARSYAKDEGLDWDAMTPAHQLKFLRRGVEETRQAKREHDGDSDFTVWRKQAAEEIGYQHRSVLRPGQEQQLRPAEERHRHAYEVSLPLIETALAQKAKLDATEFREFAVRGLIEAGIDDAAKDIKAVMRLYREHGVRQNGEMTRIWFGKDVPRNGKERWSVTTAMHVDDERAVVSLAKELSADRSGALSHDALESASQAFLASHPKVNLNSDQWKAQRQVIEQLGSGGRLAVAIGVAGAGKTTLMSPIVAAMRDDGRQVYGIARGWKQAVALRDSGVERKDTVAVSVLLSREAKGRTQLDSNSVVIIDELSQVGRGDMLRLMQLQQKYGFTMLAIGDPKQTGSIEAPVIDLLVETLGNKVPQILTSVRQTTERERTIAGLFRGGQATQAISMKIADGTAELVAGGRKPTIERVATEWVQRTAADPTLLPTIGVATNRDAHDIGVSVRQKLQEAGRIGPDLATVSVLLRGERGVHLMPLAAGDRVRVFNRVTQPDREHFASNGDVLTVLGVSKDGLTACNDAGTKATIGWDALKRRDDPAPMLAYGHALTIDAGQGSTSRVHIDAILSGSRMHQGGKGYVNESRQIETTLMFVNEAAERKQIYSKLPRGEFLDLKQDGIWRHVDANMDRQTTKATATEFIRAGTNLYRGAVNALPATLEPAERRQQQGLPRMTLQWRVEEMTARMAPAIRQVMHRVHERAQQIGRQISMR
jgi:hypothetical protein